MDRLGFSVYTANEPTLAIECTKAHTPDYIILDLNIGQTSDITLIKPLLAIAPNSKILMLTGYASIATAVTAVKLGAYHYLPKPCGIDDILIALDVTLHQANTTTSDALPITGQSRMGIHSSSIRRLPRQCQQSGACA